MESAINTVSGNGGAIIAGTEAMATKRDEVIQTMVNGAVSLGLEEARKASGKSWFAFYGGIFLSWLRKNWLWLLIPFGCIFLLWLMFRKRKSTYNNQAGRSWMFNNNRAYRSAVVRKSYTGSYFRK